MLHSLKSSIEPDHLMQSAISAFEEWRIIRKCREPIPKDLWSLVEPLTKHYKISQISTTLRLNTSQIKTGLAMLSTKETTSSQLVECSQQFSLLSNSEPVRHDCSIEFDCKQATSVKLKGLNMDGIKQVLTLLIGGPSCCN